MRWTLAFMVTPAVSSTTSILGFLEEVLESDTLAEQDRTFLDIVYRNAQRLSRLIDDLLILAERLT